MAFKFPFSNYHELNLTWVLDQLKQLFEQSSENVTVIENYNGRLTAVETELPLVSETAQGAAQNAAAAATLAQQAKSTADTAQENAIQAQGLAGQARQEAQAAQRAADAATQAAQQAQSVAQNFDGRITEAQNNASEALEASRSFENRVQAAITTANNAAQTATNAQGIATRADQNAALALDTLNAQRSELERIGAEQAALITEETENGKEEIENLAQSVLDSIPADYTALAALVDKKAPVIINSASGSIASFDDGADDMKIQKLVVNIEPMQAGSGDPSPANNRPISGWIAVELEQAGKNLLAKPFVFRPVPSVFSDCFFIKAGTYTFTFDSIGTATLWRFGISLFDVNGAVFSDARHKPNPDCYFVSSVNMYYWQTDVTIKTISLNIVEDCFIRIWFGSGNTDSSMNATGARLELGSTSSAYESYTGNQISVTFPSAAGTVYGGPLTLNPDGTGMLLVTYRKDVFDDVNNISLYWSQAGTNGNRFNLGLRTTNKKGSVDFVSNVLVPSNDVYSSARWVPYQGFPWRDNTNDFFLILPLEYTSANIADAKALIASWNLEICYQLLTPIEIPLTASDISGILSSLYGTNNIWSDAGPVSVDYPADTKLYIDGKLAELQATILENI